MNSAEHERLAAAQERREHWKRWGPYLAERAWGTVREDYSPDGTPWDYFPHDHARSRAYRWNEDGLMGISDRHQIRCFALALWNGRDPILKERLFGLSGNEGNHGEDVKELYYYLDSTPTHSYMKALYKYPQARFPYEQLLEENRRRGRHEPEFEIQDTGVFDGSRYFDVFVEYAKATPEDILIRIEAWNRGPDPAVLHVLPTLWFRNTWSWDGSTVKPRLEVDEADEARVRSLHSLDGEMWLRFEGNPELLFTENETNTWRLHGAGSLDAFAKDAFHDYVVDSRRDSVNPARTGTKCAAHHRLELPPRGSRSIRLRLSRQPESGGPGIGSDFDSEFAQRRAEADEFYSTVVPATLSDDARNVMRQSLAGLLWSKQFYHYVVRDWLRGDPAQPPPPLQRQRGRNSEWTHLYNADVLSMPDKWEYPWFAAWDLAFHCIPLAIVDPDFAKEQLLLMLREWYMHPNGQLPAYEWAFGDVNPPVLAWAAWRVYKIEKKRRGKGDRAFLKRVLNKLTINFTWWVNRKDAEGHNVFQGGFLGLDNIGCFDRSQPLPTGGHLEQADGTSWMAMYSLNLLSIALELAQEEPAYEDMASKFWEHFVHIAHSLNTLGLWDEEQGCYGDVLHWPDGRRQRLEIRSMVGLIPLFAVEVFDAKVLARFPAFLRRLEWFIDHRPDLTEGVACMRTPGVAGRRIFSVVSPERLRRVLQVMLDEKEFLSPHGIRALSAAHREHPFEFRVNGRTYTVPYEPSESAGGLFGGNSNWRGPVWFPVNFLLLEALQKFHRYLGEPFQVEMPVGTGKQVSLDQVAAALSRRLSRIFLRDEQGRRPAYGAQRLFQDDAHFRDLVLFHEYFDGDTGAGLGAIHQTGWTGLVAKLLQQSGE